LWTGVLFLLANHLRIAANSTGPVTISAVGSAMAVYTGFTTGGGSICELQASTVGLPLTSDRMNAEVLENE
jgi:hypothetical protein